MDKLEKEVIDLSAKLWNKILELPVAHPDDIVDFRFHIHAIQNIVYAREGMRSINTEPIKQLTVPREVTIPEDGKGEGGY